MYHRHATKKKELWELDSVETLGYLWLPHKFLQLNSTLLVVRFYETKINLFNGYATILHHDNTLES